MKVLAINTYGGSLLLGAKLAGAEVIGSLEDCGFGVAHQRLNFPELEVVPEIPWPDLDLSDIWVLAHPPCSAFSNQTQAHRKGQGTPAFACHERVIKYALGAGCRGLALESVPGAVQALPTYRALAAEHNYGVSTLLLNAASHGVPQWRPRAWFIFRKDFEREALAAPRDFRPVRVALLDNGTPLAQKVSPLDPALLPLFSGEHGTGLITQVWRRLNPDKITGENGDRVACGRRPGEFASRMPRLLDPDGVAPVLMASSQWYAAPDGRPRLLFLEEYCAIMGFPTDYKWPNVEQARLFLSKGVAPPVAAWVLKTMIAGRMLETNDLRPAKKEVLDATRRFGRG